MIRTCLSTRSNWWFVGLFSISLGGGWVKRHISDDDDDDDDGYYYCTTLCVYPSCCYCC